MNKFNLVQCDLTNSEKESEMKVVPYTTPSGLQIGCRYEPKAVYTVSQDMELLQSSLLSSSKATPLSRLRRFWKNCFRYD